MQVKLCLYCGVEKSEDEFSDEHIWPDALGGDYLPHDVWRTDNVCQKCNSVSGVFVDGAFIRSWIGKAELSSGSFEYLAGRDKAGPIPLDYVGPLENVPLPEGHTADFWVGPCGANIIHIRRDDADEQWATYAGGDPRAKKKKAGRAYIALTSENEFWILVSLASFYRHFDRAERFVVNSEIPTDWPFNAIDKTDPVQAEDMKTVEAVLEAGRTGRWVSARVAISFDLGSRMLAKLGLGVGYNLLGAAFLKSEYAKNLRLAMREANAEKRRSIPVRGSGFVNGVGLGGAEKVLAWPGGWVLMVNNVQGQLVLCVISPSGRSMNILISDDGKLVDTLDPKYRRGLVWITIPATSKAVGPIALPDYLAHQTNTVAELELVELAARRGDKSKLPPCHPHGNDVG